MADAKISALTEDTAPTTDDLLVTVDIGTSTTKKCTIASLFGLLYPVGSLYTSTLSTNPGTLLGVGTWTAYATGQVLVGKAAAGTFNTAGATGGAETVTLTAAQSGVPAHTHVETVGNGSAGATLMVPQVYYNSTNAFVSNESTSANTAADASQSHTNLQPYIVVYIWQRTA